MNPKKQISTLTLLVAVCVLFSNGCSKKAAHKIYYVGIVSGAEPFNNIIDGFKTKMAELGYFEGKNIVYDFQKVNADPIKEQQVIKKFVDDKVDLIFAFPTETAIMAKTVAAETNIPVVFAMAGIEMNNLVKTIRQPGGNVTGVRFPGPELTVKRFEFLRELVPHAKRILLVYDRNYPNASMALEGLRPAALAANISLVEEPVNNITELRSALQKRAESNDIDIDAILIMPDILNNSPDGFGAIQWFAAKHKIPIGGGMNFTADLGAMFSFVPDNVEMGMLAASLVDKIFKGTPAGTIPVVTPEAHLRLNCRVIQELGLTIPQGLQSRADEIIR